MTRSLFIISSTLFTAIACTTATPARQPALAYADRPQFEIHAHRGAWDRPENSLAAFLRGIELGATKIELDLQVTKDNQLVVAHDVHMRKGSCTPDEVFFRDLTLSEVKQYRCDGEEISTLPEVMEALRDSGVSLNIEVKYNPSQPQYYPTRASYAHLLIGVLDGVGYYPARIMVQSFDVEFLAALKKLRPTLTVSPLLSDISQAVTIAQRLDTNVITPHFKQVTSKTLKMCKNAGLRVIPWTVNEVEDIEAMLKLGVDGLITDRPGRVRQVLERLQP